MYVPSRPNMKEVEKDLQHIIRLGNSVCLRSFDDGAYSSVKTT